MFIPVLSFLAVLTAALWIKQELKKSPEGYEDHRGWHPDPH